MTNAINDIRHNFAARVAGKCDRQKVGFIDPVIIGLVLSALSLLVNCIRVWYEIKPGSEHDQLKQMCRTPAGRHAAIVRAAKVFRHQAKKEGRKINKSGAMELAEKTIDEAINTPDTSAKMYCSSVLSAGVDTFAFLNDDSEEEEEQ